MLRPFVTRSIVECVSSIWRGMGGIRGILRLERKLIDSVPYLSGDGSKQRARSLKDHGERWSEIRDRCGGILHRWKGPGEGGREACSLSSQPYHS